MLAFVPVLCVRVLLLVNDLQASYFDPCLIPCQSLPYPCLIPAFSLAFNIQRTLLLVFTSGLEWIRIHAGRLLPTLIVFR